MIDANAKPTKIIHVTNKKNGVTYLYEDQAFWNSEKKRGEHKRKCIGRLGPDGDEIYNEYYQAKKQAVWPRLRLLLAGKLFNQEENRKLQIGLARVA